MPEPKLMQQCVRLFYDDATVIPLFRGTTIWATTASLHGTGLGEMGASTAWTPENCWLSK